MAYTSWRGTVGVVKPTMRPGSLEEFIRMMPEGIGIIPLFIGFQRGTADEFQQAMKAYEERVAQLAGYGVDLIHPEGAPPFMFQGVKGERPHHQGLGAEVQDPDGPPRARLRSRR